MSLPEPPDTRPRADAAASEKILGAEKSLAGLRLLVIGCGSVIYLLFLRAHGNILPWLAWTLLPVAWGYGLYVYFAEPYRRHPVLRSSYFTSAVDAAIIMLWLYASGGVHSPFFVVLYPAVVAIGFRYSAKETWVACLFFGGSYLLLVAALGQLAGHSIEVVVRVTYLVIAAMLGNVISKVVLQQITAKLHVEEQLRLAAESREQRSRFLAAASDALASSLDLDVTLEHVARLIAPTLGENCVVDLVDDGGVVRRMAAVAAEPANQELLKQLRHTGGLPSSNPVARVLKTGKTEHTPHFDGALTSVTVPMIARGRILGAITLSRSQPNRPFDEEEIALAEELAGRAALAVENARLYRDAEEARARAQAAQAQAQTERDHLRALFMQVPAIITISRGPQLVWELINPLAEKFLGKRAAMGQAPAEGMPELETQGFIGLAKGVMASGQPLHGYEVPIAIDWEGSGQVQKRFFNFVFQPLREPDGRIDGVMSLAFEVTEQVVARQRVEAAERRTQFLDKAGSILASTLDYAKTLESVTHLVVPQLADWCAVEMVDTTGGVAQLALAHVDPERMAVASELRRTYPPDPAATRGICQVLRSGQPELYPEITDELLGALASDEEHRRRLRGLDVRSAMIVPLTARGHAVGAITFVHCGPERRFDTADLTLAEELARRTALAIDNARLYEQAQQAVRARDEFLSVASHELKTPLTSLTLQVQSLQRIARQPGDRLIDTDKLSSRLEVVVRQANRLTSLIENLLDVSRVTAGRLALKIEDTDLAEVVSDIAMRFRDHFTAAGCALSLRAAGSCLGQWDRLRLEQVITNLISNALKYGAGKPIEIEVQTQNGDAILSVRDHGIGIAPGDQARIFERFERAVSERNYGGLGLGLWIVRQIVSALGGRVEVSSAPGKGSRFVVWLPRTRTEIEPLAIIRAVDANPSEPIRLAPADSE